MSAADHSAWTRLTQGPCPAPDELLGVAARRLGSPAAAGLDAALDDQSRLLFAPAGSRIACVTRLTTALAFDLDYRCREDDVPEALSLEHVVQTREGHPLLVAVVAVALMRRAGCPATVCRADGRWSAAAVGSPLVVVDIEPGSRPDAVRPVCGHLVGHAVLSALQRALRRRHRDAESDVCEVLLRDLPVLAPPR